MTQSRERTALLILLAICIASRLLTSLWYIADPDSLRFALGAIDYNLIKMQPHFPGYPVFMGVVKFFTFVTGSYGIAFALVGGLSTFAIITAALKFCNTSLSRPEGVLLAALFFFNPMLWIMGNRYMPDLMGGAVLLWILALTIRNDHAPRSHLFAGIFLTGILAGVRLSYLPFALLPLLITITRTRREFTSFAVLILSVALWLLPMIIDTGWDNLLVAANAQTSGHFEEFGGTIFNVPDIESRRIAVVKGVIADGLGGYWDQRGTITIVITLGFLLLMGRGAWWMFGRETDGLVITIIAVSIYIAWILLYQNVVYQSRHMLPLIPIALALAWGGGVELMRSGIIGRLVVSLFLLGYGITGVLLALQQTTPTAIAQVTEYLNNDTEDHVILSSGLINFYLQSSGIEGNFVDAEHILPDQDSLLEGDLTMIGWYESVVNRRPEHTRSFHHNPYVNSIWAEIPVTEYGANRDR
ncbi:MAG: hypothetical protein KDD67_02735 [Ignavibacteriae bacterium]|nr:hypothetical protein [Ignavibacteriota bacterium]MCB9216957.1 hypothetical protein [Ignavibacteria bacterium]